MAAEKFTVFVLKDCCFSYGWISVRAGAYMFMIFYFLAYSLLMVSVMDEKLVNLSFLS